MEKNIIIKNMLSYFDSCGKMMKYAQRDHIIYSYGKMRGYLDFLYSSIMINQEDYYYYCEKILTEKIRYLNNLDN